MTNEEFIKSVSKEGEVWKDIPRYEGIYMASTLGRIMGLNRTPRSNSKKGYRCQKAHLLLPKHQSCGYRSISLCVDNVHTQFVLHRLIAMTFIPNPENKPIVDHIDGNRENNTVSNLRWVTPSENNLNINTRNKHTRTCEERGYPIVKLKDNKLIKIYAYLGQLVKDGYKRSAVLDVCAHKYPLHHGYQFMYYDEYNQLLEKDLSLN